MRPPHRQDGAALLIALAIAILGSLSVLVGGSSSLSPVRTRQALAQTGHETLALARDALLGRAVSDENRPGSLPCPALDENGQVPLFINNRCPSYIGRFPWKTMRTGPLRDGYGELLWYALPPSLRDHQSAEPINPDSTPLLTLDAQTDIAAIIIAPGPALAGQQGRPGNTPADYLDGDNADGDAIFVTGQGTPIFNDQLLPIRRSTLFRLVARRALGEIRGPDVNMSMTGNTAETGLRGHHRQSGAFPWADIDGNGRGDNEARSGRLPYLELELPEWLERNGWLTQVIYRLDTDHAAQLSLDPAGVFRMPDRAVTPCPKLPCA